jgi:uncharacterized protein YfaP (DUF2135 family)
MKPRNREINIFSLSMLDVLSGALGAFLVIMIVLLPYYRKDHIDYQQKIRELEKQIAVADARADFAERIAEEAKGAVESAESRAQSAEKRQQEYEQRIQKTYLMVIIEWKTGHDVDLHVVDPRGGEFSWRHPAVPGHTGKLSKDTTVGPGIEVWQIEEVPPGEYLIYANLYDKRGESRPAYVTGKIFYRDGSLGLPQTQLLNVDHSARRKQRLATVNAQIDGRIQIQ